MLKYLILILITLSYCLSQNYTDCIYFKLYNYIDCISYLNKNKVSIKKCINNNDLIDIYKYNPIENDCDNILLDNNKSKKGFDEFLEIKSCLSKIKKLNHRNKNINCKKYII